jgi:hypothetical protein
MKTENGLYLPAVMDIQPAPSGQKSSVSAMNKMFPG